MSTASAPEPTTDPRTGKSASAFRTISEVANELGLQQHVLRFWESRFSQIKPLKRGGGRRYYRPGDVDIIRRIRDLLYADGYTIKGVQKLLKDEGRLRPSPDITSAGKATPAVLDSRRRRELEAALHELEEIRKLL